MRLRDNEQAIKQTDQTRIHMFCNIKKLRLRDNEQAIKTNRSNQNPHILHHIQSKSFRADFLFNSNIKTLSDMIMIQQSNQQIESKSISASHSIKVFQNIFLSGNINMNKLRLRDNTDNE